MNTRQIEVPSWVLLESLGATTSELVDIDLQGTSVILTVVETEENESDESNRNA